ncbi:hypothetical protein [Achromobacter aloeverae]|uniref:hypothetical protein n=1 Tax=Achromobacter aloeverae TaxID=1750518 RepID=UPI0018652235|nr:hypothetical protein [Achromobacter aloeverae]
MASANAPGCDFPIQNLPYTRFSPDGDEITLTGYCSAAGRVRIGFGECRGRISAANAAPEEKAPPSGR